MFTACNEFAKLITHCFLFHIKLRNMSKMSAWGFYMKPEMKGHFELASWFHAPGSR